MPLAETVTQNTAIGNGGRWTDPHADPSVPMATSCHFATVYWLFLEEFSRVPTQAELVRIGNAQLVLSNLLVRGTRKTKPVVGHLSLRLGSILLFARNNQAGHSCVAIQAQRVGGYNQQGWYSQGGGDHSYSTHQTSELIWGNLGNRNQVRRVAAAGWYDLYEIPEMIAKATIRSLVQT